MVKLEYPGLQRKRSLIIFLPGIDDLAEDFERRGIIDDMQRMGIDADAIAVDAHYGYYAQQAFFERITEDVIVWAQEAGYREIWLAGISLGGFGAALYAAHHPSHIHGLLLFAPYLGDDMLIREIRDAGGLSHWQPGQVDENDFKRVLWTWFKQQLAQPGTGPEIYLGYGERDKFAVANALLAADLPPGQVVRIAGGHDWRIWKTIWQHFLERWQPATA